MIDLPLRLAGEPLVSDLHLEVRNPFSGEVVGRVATATRAHVEQSVRAAHRWAESHAAQMSRHERSTILSRAETLLRERAEDFARLITSEAGLCIRDTRYEVGRALDVLKFASIQALDDDGEAYACDVTAQGKPRRIMTFREPLRCAVAIAPFNHPLNTVAHKVAPAIAAGTPLILKPSEKTPLTALRFAALLAEAGLPGPMLSVLVGPTHEVAEPLVCHLDVEALTFTGSTHVGLKIAHSAGYKRLALELGGNSELIVLADADIDLAARLACEGAFRNSGQRCTAAKRLLVARSIVEPFTKKLLTLAAEYSCGDPSDESTRVGTVIDEASAIRLKSMIDDAVRDGARLLLGGSQRGAQLTPTVLDSVPRTSRIVREEAFGPIAKVIPVEDVEDAIQVANDSSFGLSTSVVTNSIDAAMAVIRKVRTGTVNVNEVPGYRSERSPFGGVKMSGLGVKEGVVEASRWYSTVKTFSLPW